MLTTARTAAAFSTVALLSLAGCALGPFSQHVASNTKPTPSVTATSSATLAAASKADVTQVNPPIPDSTSQTKPIEWQDITVPSAGPAVNLWTRIRRGFRLPDGNRARVQQQLQWYKDHPGYMVRTADRAKPYLYYVVSQLTKRGMPTDLALLPIVESAYDPFAYSYSRAAGLWQFISSTAQNYGIEENWWYDGRRAIGASTKAALNCLSGLHKQFGSWLLALAAYNSGAITVQDAIDYNRRHGEPTDFWALQLPLQTRNYVPRLLAIRDIVAHPERYGIHLPFIPNEQYLAQVKLKGQIDLAVAANMLGISLKQMYLLNPGYNRWATPPDGPSTLFIPRAKKAEFLSKLDKMHRRIHVQWVAYRIRPGDNLRGLAHRYHTTVAELRSRNNLRDNLIVAGRTLMVPSSNQRYERYVIAGGNMRIAKVSSIHKRRKLGLRVRRGDTLWSISRRYRVSVASLARWNHIKPSSPLHLGQHLVVWIGGQRPSLGQTMVNKTGAHKVQYVVRNGDSLWTISNRFHVSTTQLANWNQLNKSSVLHPGQDLVVWVGKGAHEQSAGHGQYPESAIQRISYVVHSGDSLSTISNRFNVSLRKLAHWNSLTLSSILHPGQRLTLFVDVRNQS